MHARTLVHTRAHTYIHTRTHTHTLTHSLTNTHTCTRTHTQAIYTHTPHSTCNKPNRYVWQGQLEPLTGKHLKRVIGSRSFALGWLLGLLKLLRLEQGNQLLVCRKMGQEPQFHLPPVKAHVHIVSGRNIRRSRRHTEPLCRSKEEQNNTKGWSKQGHTPSHTHIHK